MLGWDQYGFDKKRARTRCAKLVFLHPMGSAGHVQHFGASRVRNSNALFFMLLWDQYIFDKKCVETHYAELVFLHLVRSSGHVVHSGVAGTRNDNTLFFMHRWTRTVLTKDALGHVVLNMYFCIWWNLWVL
jgi:hypothetical protein